MTTNGVIFQFLLLVTKFVLKMGWMWCGYGKRFGAIECKEDVDAWEHNVKQIENSEDIVDICSKNTHSIARTSSV